MIADLLEDEDPEIDVCFCLFPWLVPGLRVHGANWS